MKRYALNSMSREVVFFGVLNDRFRTVFDRSQLRIGRIVYVTFDESGHPSNFSLTESDGAVPHCVAWIAPSEWYVPLRTRLQPEPDFIERVLRATDGLLSRSIVEKSLNTAASDVRLDEVFKSSAYQNSRLHLINTVIERLDLVERLQGEEISKLLRMHDTPLSVYLLLTCFDRLGQPADWLSFEEWIYASKTSDEREAVLEQQSKESTYIDVTKALLKSYNLQYGVKSSFFRFLHEILPKNVLGELLASLKIESRTLPPDIGELMSAGDESKKLYLYRLRNDYTHRSMIGTRNGLDNELTRKFQLDHRNAWMYQEQTIDSKKWNQVMTLGWPYTLERCVRIGLASYLTNLAEELV